MSGRKAVQVSRDELESAFVMLSMMQQYECSAWIDVASGKVSVHSPYIDSDEEEAPKDDEADGFIPIPDKKELGLGRSLAMRFASEVMPDDYRTIADRFRQRGAYSRFKYFLQRRGMLQLWYEYEERATDEALAAWCEDNGIELVDEPRHDGSQPLAEE